MPGVGKSTYSSRHYKDKCFVVNPDILRTYHPQYHSLSTNNVIEETNAFASQLGEALIESLAKRRCNMLAECTFADFDYWRKVLSSNSLRSEIYTRRLIILSAPIEVCYEAMCSRYGAEGQSNEAIRRPADRAFLVDRATKLVAALDKYHSGNVFDDLVFLHKRTMSSDFEQIDYRQYLEIHGKDHLTP